MGVLRHARKRDYQTTTFTIPLVYLNCILNFWFLIKLNAFYQFLFSLNYSEKHGLPKCAFKFTPSKLHDVS